MHNRGPDDFGFLAFDAGGGKVCLGHTRLAVLDLSAGGHQPMQSRDGRYTISYNGEIYNYRELRGELGACGHSFSTNSDTEVILAAWAQWGEHCLQRLVGMFSFAVYDLSTQVIVLARDAFGIKPLYYSIQHGELAFASEITALLQLLPNPPALNIQRAYDYLVHSRYDDRIDTFYDAILQLPPGHVLTVALNPMRVAEPKRWWWPSIQEHANIRFGDAVERVREMFLSNVRLHMRSDVLLGAALSGGVDSSAIVCAMRYLEPHMPIHTFTFVAGDARIDEERWADIVNGQVKAMPHKTRITSAEFAADLDDMISCQGEPFRSTSIYAQYRVYRLVRETGVTVMLDGQGADELFAGYNGYAQWYVRSLIERRQTCEVTRFLRDWSRWPQRGGKQAFLELGAALTPTRWQTQARRLIGRHPSPSFLAKDWLHSQEVSMVFPDRYSASEEGRGRRLVEQLRDAVTGQGLAALLRHGDRNSMRWSIESRVPFLTTEMAEFVLSLPESFLVSPAGETKRVFRAAMRGIVPDRVLNRRDKIGFQTPEYEWLRGQEDVIGDWLSEAARIPFLSAAECRKAVNRSLADRERVNGQAWRLINYCRWVQAQRERV